MRVTILIPALLFAGCVEGRAEAVAARVGYGDLSLDSREGRAVLRQRVAGAARSYCAAHGAEVTPHASRADPYYCTDMLRSWIMGEMAPEVRRAYSLARHEAGVRGRRL